jgi:hypothetical protein
MVDKISAVHATKQVQIQAGEPNEGQTIGQEDVR